MTTTPPSLHQPDPRQGSLAAHPPDETVALLTAEAFSLVMSACSTRVGMQALQGMAGQQTALLEQAAVRCSRVDELDPRIREHAAQLLRGAASSIRLDQPGPPAGAIRT